MVILTAIDRDPGCKGVVETAYDLATKMDMKLVILHVVPEDEDEEAARREIEDIVMSVIGDLEGIDLRIMPEQTRRDLPTGRTANHILQVAEELDPDYIVIGSRKRTGLGKILLGSVSKLILANADVPVVTVEQTRKAEA
ncbi:universal stress protein [Haloplanus aerogenes]|uniref:Nucleotide-binding universal stress UspA family protein n=1 Tax=Haloplanus aerogenes TaxID=660522 RepID=A0A3M0CV09_9EURY|nr:universal stress protein [Haloplanus aerogenes]AZH24026.1 universal stress protein [Haloplanus aerogenes]RMB13202.1 nucleotide-binding universal stress UspA family protein [Haloplanus aerogenes]